jgi:hypothetical protein
VSPLAGFASVALNETVSSEGAAIELPVLALVRDLMFSSRITAAARAAGVPVKILRDPGALAVEAGRLVLLDLNQAGTIDAAVAWKTAHPEGQTIGFVSHIDAETIERARAAGIDRVLARGQFVQILPELLG